MKKALRYLLIALGSLMMLVLLFVVYTNFKSFPTYDNVSIPALSVTPTPELVAAGKKLVDLNCAGCHKSKNGKYEGQKFPDDLADEAFGKIYTPNITQDPTYGIGNYSDGELFRLIRTGVKKNGEVMLPIMPKWVICADEDIHAMIAYLKSNDKSVQPSKKEHPTYQPSLLAKVLLNYVIKPEPYPAANPVKPTPDELVAHGEYLVNAAYGCYWCHSAGLDVWNLPEPTKTPGYLGGGTKFVEHGNEVIAPSILMDGNTDTSNWSEEEFFKALRYGERPGKPAYQSPMKPYVLLDTVEIQAIHAYLKSFEPVDEAG